MIRFFTLYCAIIINVLLTIHSVNAVEVKDLYQAQVIVDNQSDNVRRDAIKQAMFNVLVKVSGTTTVSENPVLKQAIRQPSNYFLQYRYESIDDARYLIVDFDEDKVNHLFFQAKKAIWGRLRPQILMWLIEEDGLSRKIISSSDDSFIAKKIKSLTKARGLPVIQPLMDLEDLNKVSVSELWGRFIEPTYIASERYLPEKVLIVRVSKNVSHGIENCTVCDESGYVIDWSIIEDQQQLFSQPYEGINSDVLLPQLVNDLTTHIYQQYALEVTADNDIFIDVNNITRLTDYADVSVFLSELSSVQHVVLTEVNGTHYRFKLTIAGSKSALLASLKLSRQLVQTVDLFKDKASVSIPVFNWQAF